MNYRRSYYNFNEKNVYTVKLIYFFKDKKKLVTFSIYIFYNFINLSGYMIYFTALISSRSEISQLYEA